jgi:hypothetical protein
VLALSNAALIFRVDFDWWNGVGDLALGLMSCVCSLVSLMLGQSEFILGIQRSAALNNPLP